MREEEKMEDLISRQKAEHIEQLKTIGCDGWNVTADAYESLKWAIEALNQQTCEDVISRQSVINSFKNWLNDNKDPRSFEEVVKEMPSAISSQKEGE